MFFFGPESAWSPSPSSAGLCSLDSCFIFRSCFVVGKLESTAGASNWVSSSSSLSSSWLSSVTAGPCVYCLLTESNFLLRSRPVDSTAPFGGVIFLLSISNYWLEVAFVSTTKDCKSLVVPCLLLITPTVIFRAAAFTSLPFFCCTRLFDGAPWSLLFCIEASTISFILSSSCFFWSYTSTFVWLSPNGFWSRWSMVLKPGLCWAYGLKPWWDWFRSFSNAACFSSLSI